MAIRRRRKPRSQQKLIVYVATATLTYLDDDGYPILDPVEEEPAGDDRAKTAPASKSKDKVVPEPVPAAASRSNVEVALEPVPAIAVARENTVEPEPAPAVDASVTAAVIEVAEPEPVSALDAPEALEAEPEAPEAPIVSLDPLSSQPEAAPSTPEVTPEPEPERSPEQELDPERVVQDEGSSSIPEAPVPEPAPAAADDATPAPGAPLAEEPALLPWPETHSHSVEEPDAPFWEEPILPPVEAPASVVPDSVDESVASLTPSAEDPIALAREELLSALMPVLSAVDLEAPPPLAVVTPGQPAQIVEPISSSSAGQSAPSRPFTALDRLVAPLSDPGLAPEERESIETELRRTLHDPEALASSPALDASHPLRVAAGVVAELFTAVCSGPVEDERLALPSISFRSPLAPWKMLLRAIACFHRRDDEGCRKAFTAIPADSAPHRLGPVFGVLVDSAPLSGLKARGRKLAERFAPSTPRLREALVVVDKTLQQRKIPVIIRAVREAIARCKAARPDLLGPLRQRLSVQGSLLHVPVKQMAAAMGGPAEQDANLHRLSALAFEGRNSCVDAVREWARFLDCAIQEGWFPRESPELAAVYLHMAGIVSIVPFDELPKIRNREERDVARRPGGGPVKRNPKEAPEESSTYYLDPGALFAKAAAADPDPEIFQQWLDWAESIPRNGKRGISGRSSRIADRWRRAFPADARPLLLLAVAAEGRGELEKAIECVAEAERLEGLDPAVRKVRLRLTMKLLLRQVENGNPELIRKTLLDLEALPLAREGDRPAFQTAVRACCSRLEARPEEAATERASLVRQLGSEAAAQIVLFSLDCRAEQPTSKSRGGRHIKGAARFSQSAEPALPEAPPEGLLAAVGRACALLLDLGVRMKIPRGWVAALTEDCGKQEVPAPHLLAAGLAALGGNQLPLAYAVSGAGLALNSSLDVRFLLIRADSLPDWADERRSDCVRAAVSLARRSRNEEWIKLAVDALHEVEEFGLIFVGMPGPARPDATVEEVEATLRAEKENRSYPKEPPRSGRGSQGQDRGNWCPDCREYHGVDEVLPFGIDEDLDFDDFDGELDGEFGAQVVAGALEDMLGLPPELSAIVAEAIRKHGGPAGLLPSPEELEARDPELAKRLAEAMAELEEQGRKPFNSRAQSRRRRRRR